MKIFCANFFILLFVSEFIFAEKLEYSFQTEGGKNFLVIKSPKKQKKNQKLQKRRQKRKLQKDPPATDTEPIKEKKMIDFDKILSSALKGAAAGAIPAFYHKYNLQKKEKLLTNTLTQQQEILAVMKEDDQILFEAKLELQKVVKKIVAVQQSLVFRMNAKDDAILEILDED